MVGLAGLFAVTFALSFVLFIAIKLVLVDGYARLAADEGYLYAITATCGGGPARLF